MASYAPGLEELYVEMLSRMDELEGRDFSYAVNTGTGVFKGLAMASVLLSSMGGESYLFAERLVTTFGRVLEGWGWRAATRVLSNYVLALIYLYDYTGDERYLSAAERAASRLFEAQVRDEGDPRDGGFLDAVHPYGAAAYLDVSAEAAHALLELYERTGNISYREAVDYMMEHWFHRDEGGRWYYYRYAGPEGAPGERWYKGYLDEEPPYALGYLLQALSEDYWDDPRLLASASRIWSLLTDEYWVPTRDGAGETNVETQSSASAGLRDYLYSMAAHTGVGVEYVRGGVLRSLEYEEHDLTRSAVRGVIDKPGDEPATIALYIPHGEIELVQADDTPIGSAPSLASLSGAGADAYYWDPSNRILYLRLHDGSRFTVLYRRALTNSPGGDSQSTTSTSTPPPQHGDHGNEPIPHAAIVVAVAGAGLALLLAAVWGRRR